MVFRQPKWFLPRLPENNHRRLTFAALFVNRHYAGQLFADIVDAGVVAGVGRHQAAEAIAAIAADGIHFFPHGDGRIGVVACLGHLHQPAAVGITLLVT